MSQTITIGVTDLSFHHVAASLVSNVLNDMGFKVKRKHSHHEENFKRLRNDEIDLLASAWLPSSHGGYKSDVEKNVPLTELGRHYEPYALWGVPEYIPETAIKSVVD